MAEKRLKQITGLINYLSKLSIGELVAPPKMRDLSGIKGAMKDLKKCEVISQRLRKLIREAPRIKQMLLVQAILKAVLIPYFSLVLITILGQFLLGIQNPNFDLLTDIVLSPIVLIVMIVLGNVFLVMRWYSKGEVRKFIHSQRGNKFFTEVKEDTRKKIQRYINILRNEIKKKGEDPNDYKFRVFHKDYNGIEIDKKSLSYAGFYLAKVKL